MFDLFCTNYSVASRCLMSMFKLTLKCANTFVNFIGSLRCGAQMKFWYFDARWTTVRCGLSSMCAQRAAYCGRARRLAQNVRGECVCVCACICICDVVTTLEELVYTIIARTVAPHRRYYVFCVCVFKLVAVCVCWGSAGAASSGPPATLLSCLSVRRSYIHLCTLCLWMPRCCLYARIWLLLSRATGKCECVMRNILKEKKLWWLEVAIEFNHVFVRYNTRSEISARLLQNLTVIRHGFWSNIPKTSSLWATQCAMTILSGTRRIIHLKRAFRICTSYCNCYQPEQSVIYDSAHLMTSVRFRNAAPYI